MRNTLFIKPLFRSLIAFMILAGGELQAIIVMPKSHLSSSKEELDNISNQTDIMIDDVLILTGNGIYSFEESNFEPTLSGNTTIDFHIDLQGVNDFSQFNTGEYTLTMNGTIYLPVGEISSVTSSFNIDLGATARIIPPTTISVDENHTISIDFDDTNTSGILAKKPGDSEYKPIEDFTTNKITISDIAWLARGYQISVVQYDGTTQSETKNNIDLSSAILDLTNHHDNLDPIIDKNMDIPFTIRTTPSIGIKIGKDASSIEETIKIQLNLVDK